MQDIYEVPIIYKGRCDFIVRADSAEEAQLKAAVMFDNGDRAVSLTDEREKIEQVGDITVFKPQPSQEPAAVEPVAPAAEEQPPKSRFMVIAGQPKATVDNTLHIVENGTGRIWRTTVSAVAQVSDGRLVKPVLVSADDYPRDITNDEMLAGALGTTAVKEQDLVDKWNERKLLGQCSATALPL